MSEDNIVSLSKREEARIMREAEILVSALKPLINGHHPAVQGAAIAELFALWIAGHNEAVRDQMFEMQIEAVRAHYPQIAKAIWKSNSRLGKQYWRGTT
jgi:hypothetical protein